jgi:hypothetical protein
MKDSEKLPDIEDQCDEYGHDWDCDDEEYEGDYIVRYMYCQNCGRRGREYYRYDEFEME